ncbi:uncharacterized protein LOC6564001 [Drosophila grimshawi]|uniref:GH18575 n=1 Tax=Drosophila grimshawi TaxID=7222 RepID=B4JHZ7_DROGR|nr:uncharacterized protein LOC6564001 [Drosophila grimshawi]EDV92905.1 GH18575 [Drosophila grimshawi]
MDTNQKSVENFETLQSSGSRRVMWEGCVDEEEVYDSIVTYKTLSRSRQAGDSTSTTSEHIQSPAIECQSNIQTSAIKSSTSLAMRYKPSHESLQNLASTKRSHARGCWHQLVDRIRNKKLDNEASANLALRYKPSHESFQDQVVEHSEPKVATADLKLETCFFPPIQIAVVREVAPKFANRMCITDDSESGYSKSIELQIPLLNSSSKYSKTDGTDSNKDALPAGTKRSKSRNNTRAATSNGSSKGGSIPNNAMPTLRQRQQELHRYRVQTEKRRLELLDLKIVRERAEALRREILFHKDLQLKHNQIKSFEDTIN